MIDKNITIKNYYWMLAYAFNSINETDSSKIEAEEFENIYELLCFILTMELNKQIKRGLNKTYVPFEEETREIRGKININNSIKRVSFLNKKLSIEYDEYSINSPLNQIIKTAGKFLLKSNRIKTKKYSDELIRVLKFLSDVEELNPSSIKWSSLRYDRNNASYRMIINVSYFILNGLLSTNEYGEYKFNNYLDNRKMHQLYEKFILEYYRYHYRGYLNAGNPRIDWITDHTRMLPNMLSDIILYNKVSGKKLIIDAKYYSNAYQENEYYNRETFRSNNLYQIFTYVKNEDKLKNGNVCGMLLYAKTDNNDNIDEEYNMDGNIIRVSNLDLSMDFEHVKTRLNSYVEWFINI